MSLRKFNDLPWTATHADASCDHDIICSKSPSNPSRNSHSNFLSSNWITKKKTSQTCASFILSSQRCRTQGNRKWNETWKNHFKKLVEFFKYHDFDLVRFSSKQQDNISCKNLLKVSWESLQHRVRISFKTLDSFKNLDTTRIFQEFLFKNIVVRINFTLSD